MLDANLTGRDPEVIIRFRSRVDHLREEYQRTCKLLEQEGKRLNGFLEGMPAGRLKFGQSGYGAENQKLLSDLTAREKDILRCIAEGCSTKETAARLGIRFKTAACHRYRVMQKLGVHETTSLVHFAIRCGIVRV